MSDLFYEIDESIQEERFIEKLRKFRFIIIGAITLLLSSVAAYTAYDYYKIVQARKDYVIYKSALEYIQKSEIDEALEKFDEIIKYNRSGYSQLARLMKIKISHQQSEGDKLGSEIASYHAINRDWGQILILEHNIANLIPISKDIAFAKNLHNIKDLSDIIYTLTNAYNKVDSQLNKISDKDADTIFRSLKKISQQGDLYLLCHIIKISLEKSMKR